MNTRNVFAALLFVTISTMRPGLTKAEEGKGLLTVEVQNIKSDEGQIGCSLFSKEEGFPNESAKALVFFFVTPKARKATCVFKNVKPGTYAVSVMHDLDKDGELDTSLVGRPKEPWAVSKNIPAERFGPPKFGAAKFEYGGADMTIKVRLSL